MKKLILFIVLIFAVGCSNDSEKTDNLTQALFIGKWTPENEKDYSSDNKLTTQFDLSKEPCYHMTTYEFRSDNQFVKDSYDWDGKNCVKNTLRTYNYSYSNNIIIIDKTDSHEVVENTNSILKLKIVNSDKSYTIIEYSKVK